MTATKRSPRRALVIGVTRQEIEALLPLARVVSQKREVQPLVLGLIVLPAEQTLSAGARPAQQFRSELAAMPDSDFRTIVRVTHDLRRELKHIVSHEHADFALISADSPLVAEILDVPPCNIIVVKGQFPQGLTRILLPIRGGPFAALALQTALALGNACNAEITVLQALSDGSAQDKQTNEFLKHLKGLPQITRREKVHGDAAQAILEYSALAEHQLIVMGAAGKWERRSAPFGPVVTRILAETKIPVLIVKTAAHNAGHAGDANLPPVDYTISVIVDKWFAENTFHAHEFEDIAQLVALKEKQGLTISLGLPTLNEEETIGSVIRTMQTRFVRDYPLLDEIVVIDSNSTDRTVEIAQELGMPVVKHPDVLTQYGAYVGKGEALWNSLYVLRGDLIAWIDTDIANIHPRFVYGILGPLIREPRLMYVKGFYQRPLRLGKKLEARGGGRVTELTARPLLNLFYPELSGFVQPLSGEYAGRRAALEQVPFFVGYGVETGLLIDLWSRFGLQALGQVDLEERVHRNQSLHALSKMAFEIVQVVMQRVGESRNIELVEQINRSMKLIHYDNAAFDLEVADIQIRERPPMITIPEYRKLRGLAD
jgi:glycosyltransferase involved in cell wall biosynthesis/nucleotide-binding universal stress UspA family protein